MPSLLKEPFRECSIRRGLRRAKMTAALDLACRDSENGTKTAAVLLLETGGVRLQEANLGLAAIAEVIASILAVYGLHAPVINLMEVGTVGCFGGMSLAAGVSSCVRMTREARLGLNGPGGHSNRSQGVDEFDFLSDRTSSGQFTAVSSVSGWGWPDALVED